MIEKIFDLNGRKSWLWLSLSELIFTLIKYISELKIIENTGSRERSRERW